MSDELIAALLQSGGPLGVVIVGAAIYILKLQRRLDEVQERRVGDAQKVTAQMLALAEGQNQVKAKLVETLSRNTEAIRAMREEFLRR